MRLILLVEDRLFPIPGTISILEDWGTISMIRHSTKGYVKGRHLLIEAPDDSIIEWLAPFDSAWVGSGAPMLQQFSLQYFR